MGNAKRKIEHAPSVHVGRSEPRDEMERAERIADDLAGMREEAEWQGELLARFRDAGPTEVVSMWKSGTNEKGRPLSKFETAALAERWCALFGFRPPTDGAKPATLAELKPADDTMLDIDDVARMTGLSVSSINRKYRETPPSFPPPTQLSTHRKGWPARVVKDWINEREWRPSSRVTRKLCMRPWHGPGSTSAFSFAWLRLR